MMTLALDMKYNRLSDCRLFKPCIEVYILLLTWTNLQKTEGAAVGSMVSAVIANLHLESYSDNLTMQLCGIPANHSQTESFIMSCISTNLIAWRRHDMHLIARQTTIPNSESEFFTMTNRSCFKHITSLKRNYKLHQRALTLSYDEKTSLLTNNLSMIFFFNNMTPYFKQLQSTNIFTTKCHLIYHKCVSCNLPIANP